MAMPRAHDDEQHIVVSHNLGAGSGSSLTRKGNRSKAQRQPVSRRSGSSSSLSARSTHSAKARKPARPRKPGAGSSSSSTAKRGTKKVSHKLEAKRNVHPFSKGAKKYKTKFAEAYQQGNFPVRINHGSVSHRLQWDRNPEEMSDYEYGSLLLLAAEGLRETAHPYSFVAQNSFAQLMRAAEEKVLLDSVKRILLHVRAALSSNEEEAFCAGLGALRVVSEELGTHLNAHLNSVLQQLNKRVFKKQSTKEIFELLDVLAANGGPDAVVKIKKKVPTYTGL